MSWTTIVSIVGLLFGIILTALGGVLSRRTFAQRGAIIRVGNAALAMCDARISRIKTTLEADALSAVIDDAWDAAEYIASKKVLWILWTPIERIEKATLENVKAILESVPVGLEEKSGKVQ